MEDAFMGILDTLKNGTFGFEQIFAYVKELWVNILANDHIAATLAWLTASLEVVTPYIPYILIALHAILWLFGQRLYNVIRFLAFFIIGFLLGTYYLADIVIGFVPEIPAFAVGIAVGLVAAVLAKLLYYILYTVAAGYGMYLVCVTGMVLPEIKGNYMVALIVAAIAIILVYVLRNFIERFGTAFLGAYGMLTVVRGWYDFTVYLPGYEWAVMLGGAALVALIGYAVQVKNRKKKY